MYPIRGVYVALISTVGMDTWSIKDKKWYFVAKAEIDNIIFDLLVTSMILLFVQILKQ